MTYIDKDKALNLDFKINVNLFESRRKTAERAVQAYADAINAIHAADVRPVVFCRDCVYWQKPQVRLNDGTYRDYEPGEYENGSFFGGVTVDVGINIGSFCAKYNTEHQNQIPQFMGENDFCSKGYKLLREER